jgi:hypothetical protein
MDLLFDDDEPQSEQLVLELLNSVFYIFSKAGGSWVRQTPGEFCRLFVYRNGYVGANGGGERRTKKKEKKCGPRYLLPHLTCL